MDNRTLDETEGDDTSRRHPLHWWYDGQGRFRRKASPSGQADNYAQAPYNAAFEGNAEGLLRMVSASTGKTLVEMRLESPPIWDGLAAAEGKLYISNLNGQVVCMRGND